MSVWLDPIGMRRIANQRNGAGNGDAFSGRFERRDGPAFLHSRSDVVRIGQANRALTCGHEFDDDGIAIDYLRAITDEAVAPVFPKLFPPKLSQRDKMCLGRAEKRVRERHPSVPNMVRQFQQSCGKFIAGDEIRVDHDAPGSRASRLDLFIQRPSVHQLAGVHFLVAPENVALRVIGLGPQPMGETGGFRRFRVKYRTDFDARPFCEFLQNGFSIELVLGSVENDEFLLRRFAATGPEQDQNQKAKRSFHAVLL